MIQLEGQQRLILGYLASIRVPDTHIVSPCDTFWKSQVSAAFDLATQSL